MIYLDYICPLPLPSNSTSPPQQIFFLTSCLFYFQNAIYLFIYLYPDYIFLSLFSSHPLLYEK